MNDRIELCKNECVNKRYQTEMRNRGGYAVNYECRKKRGCFFCDDAQEVGWDHLTREEHDFAMAPPRPKRQRQQEDGLGLSRFIICPYEKCPYHELDKYKSYEEYEADERNKVVNIRGFFRFLTGG